MLLLQYSPTSLKWEDLREDEKKVINDNACGALQFMWVLRHGYCSTIAFQKKKGKRLRVKEVDRYEVCTDKRLCADYFYFSPLAGWRTYFHDKKDDGVDDNHMYRSYDFFSENNDGPHAYHAYGYEEFRDWIRESHKYFDFKDKEMPRFKHNQHYKPYCFLRTYLKNLPASEQFCKCGYYDFAMSKMLCNIKDEMRRKFIKWIRSNKIDSEVSMKYKITELYSCAKRGINIKDKFTKQIRLLRKNIEEFSKELGIENYGNIQIKPLSDPKEFKKTGEYFHNCVGDENQQYKEKMARRETFIAVVYRNGTPEECVEINPNTKQILQELGKRNKRSQYYSELNPLVIQYANSRQLNLN